MHLVCPRNVSLLCLLLLTACPDAAPPQEPPPDDDDPTCLVIEEGAVVSGGADARAAVQDVVESAVIAGAAIGVARSDDVVWLEGFGDAQPQQQIRATPDTPFAIASVTKVLVATAALQLVQDGVLDLDTDVGVLAPALAGVRNPAFADVPITPRMLLTHTSTLWDVPFTFDATWVTHGDSPVPMRDFVLGYFDPTSASFGGGDMWWTNAAPGLFSCYSNMAIGVLGVLVEELSGRSLEDQLRARIFEPLGMDHTSFLVSSYCDADDLARGSQPLGATRADGFSAHNIGEEGDGGQPEGHPELASGMLKTSARDLLQFTRAIAGGGVLDGARILDAETVELLLTRQLDSALTQCGDGRSDPAQQALGFMHLPDPAGTDWTGHYGGMNGATAALWFDPAPDGLRYVVLMNQLDVAAMSALEVALLENVPP